MTNANTQVIAKVAAVLAGLGLIVSSFAVIAPAQAQTSTTTTTTTSTAVTFSRDLTVGSTGADVTALQAWLISKGFAIPAGATGYFGAQTKAAVAAFQAANGITPAAGYFGPITRAKVNSMGGSTTTGGTTTTGGGTTTTTGGLQGGEADLRDFDLVSEDGTVDANEEGAALATARFDVEDADVRVQRMEIDVTVDNNSNLDASERPWAYFDDIAVEADGKVLAHVDASDRDEWDEQDTGTYRLTLNGLDYVVREGDRAELTITADVQDLDSDEEGSDITINVPEDGIRSVDAAGIQQYIGDDSDDVSVSFDGEEMADLSVRSSSDNESNGTLVADEDDSSDEQDVLSFEIRNTNEADALLDSIVIDVDDNGAGLDLEDVINRATLTIDGDDYDGDVDNAGTITFDDLDTTVSGDDTIDGVLTIRLSAAGSGLSANYSSGDELTFTLDGDNIEAEDDNTGDDITGISGAVTSTQSISLTDVSVDPTSATATVNSDGDLGTFTIKFTVKAEDDDLYVPATAGTTGTEGAVYSIEGDTTGATVNDRLDSSADEETDLGADNAVGGVGINADTVYYRVNAGDSETFTLSVSISNPADADFFSVTLEEVNYAVDDTDAALESYNVDEDDSASEAGPVSIEPSAP